MGTVPQVSDVCVSRVRISPIHRAALFAHLEGRTACSPSMSAAGLKHEPKPIERLVEAASKKTCVAK